MAKPLVQKKANPTLTQGVDEDMTYTVAWIAGTGSHGELTFPDIFLAVEFVNCFHEGVRFTISPDNS